MDYIFTFWSMKPFKQFHYGYQWFKLNNFLQILYTTDRSAIETKPDISQLRFVALDCETVGGYVEPPKNQSANIVGRVSIVDENLECIYDKFVKARTKVKTILEHTKG